ncbi:signal transduction histidine kinase [Catenuloplanes nepalensis]|uniref:histidine kinase n=1 Tax=Catenuloplanes nepalensis TaxID=587533 RepID=A0ABT9MRD6_9ACTN|nr:histidine kinase [Catenuloplanes nepalensis]MDP9793980.1 signal transduction histidine kinase [Catenuloplanes nepalensis]
MKPRRTLSPALIVAAVTCAVLATAMCTVGVSGPLARVLPAVIVGGAVGAAVWTVRRARADRADYEARLTAWAASEAVLAERLHIARDLHDIVSHGLGLITVRAAATRHLPKPPEVAEALTDIEEAGRQATAELRRMLGVLRSAAPLTPVDSLDDLASIAADAERTGLRVDLDVGEVATVSRGVQVAVARTVREGLANAARHAGPSDVRVRVHRDGAHVVVTVADAGPAPGWRATPGAGHGLAGLRERVGNLGGALSATEVDGGFRLTARIPDPAASDRAGRSDSTDIPDAAV